VCSALVACVYLAPKASAWTNSAGFTFAYMGFGGFLLLALPSPAGARREMGRLGRAMAWIGEHSYSIYLWHVPIQATLLGAIVSARPAFGHFWLYAPTFLCVSWGTGILMAKIIEIPVLHLRDRLVPTRPGTG
jgi:peptidoglycan/LPS O-acetylase OafA/YrhL